MKLLKITCDSYIKIVFKWKDLHKTAVANITSNSSAIMEQTTVIIFDRKNIYLVDSIYHR